MLLSLLAALALAQTNPGTISAANAAGFASGPSSASPWTAQSYTPIQSNGGTTYISVTSSSGLGTLHIYSTLGNGPLVQVNDNSITRIDTGASGAIAAGVSTLYAVPLPPGVSYVAASAWTSGSVSIFGVAGSSSPAAIPGVFGMKFNGSAVFTTFSTPSAVQSFNTTPGALSTNNGNALGTLRLGVLVANTGSNDAWVATTSGAYMWVVPAGSQAYIPVGNGVTLYAVTVAGSAALTATEYGY